MTHCNLLYTMCSSWFSTNTRNHPILYLAYKHVYV